jgi:hypothetical protein
LEWLTETGNAGWGWRLGAALFRFWEAREFITEGRDRLGKLLRLPAPPTMVRERVRIIYGPEYTADDQLPKLRSRGLIGWALR